MKVILETSVQQSSGGLSTGAKAGIGAGLRVAALLVVDYYCGSVEFTKNTRYCSSDCQTSAN
jgi:hypothetical protein